MNINRDNIIKLLMYLAAVVVINVAGASLFMRFDLTSRGMYSLSDASIEAVETLKEPLKINAFFSKNLPPQMGNIEQYLKDMLDLYASHAGSNFSYRFYNVTADEGDLSEEAAENRTLAQEYGINPQMVQKVDQDEVKSVKAYMGLVLIHGDITEIIPAVASTEGLEYQITSTIKKMNNKISALLRLKDKIRIHVVHSSSMADIARAIELKGLNELNGRMKTVVDKLNSASYGKLELKVTDPSTAGEAGIENFKRFAIKWPDMPDKGVKAGEGYLAVGIQYGDKSFETSLLSRKMALTSKGLTEQYSVKDDKEIESFISGNIDSLIDINESIGYVGSNGTVMLASQLPPQMQMMRQKAQAISNFDGLLRQNYTIKNVMLKDGIPEGIRTLIIAGAKNEFSEWELLQIDQFLMRGGSLAIFSDSFKEVQQQRQQMFGGMNQPVYLPLNTGLEKLLEHYGIKAEKSYVMDKSCFTNRDQFRGEIPIYFAPMIKNRNINHELGFLENIKGLITLKSSPLTVDKDKLKKNGIDSKVLFSSTSNAWEMKGRINLMPMMIKPPVDDKSYSKYPLAYLLEGSFSSYFDGRTLPEKPVEDKNKKEDNKDKKTTEVVKTGVEAAGGVLTKGRPGRIFLTGTSDIIKDNVVDRGGEGPNAMFVMNTIDYLNNNEGLAVMRSKEQVFSPLKDTTHGTRLAIKSVVYGGLPLGVILAGIFVWIGRKKRKNQIREVFRRRES